MAKTTGKKKAGGPTKDSRKNAEDPGTSRDPDFIPLMESSSSGSELERVRRRILEASGKRIVEDDPQEEEETRGGRGGPLCTDHSRQVCRHCPLRSRGPSWRHRSAQSNFLFAFLGQW